MTRGFKSLQRKLNRAQRDIKGDILDDAHEETKGILRRSHRYILMDDAVASGQLANSFYLDRNGNRIEIGNTAPYAKYVEYGTGIYFGASTWPVPAEFGPYKSADFSTQLILAIMKWARIKPSLQISGDTRSFAVAVAKKIDEKGTEPQPFWRPSVGKGKYEIIISTQKRFSQKLRRIFK